MQRILGFLSATVVILFLALPGCGGVGYDEGPGWYGPPDYYGGGYYREHGDHHDGHDSHMNAFHAEGGDREASRGAASTSGHTFSAGHFSGGSAGGGGGGHSGGGGGGHR